MKNVGERKKAILNQELCIKSINESDFIVQKIIQKGTTGILNTSCEYFIFSVFEIVNGYIKVDTGSQSLILGNGRYASFHPPFSIFNYQMKLDTFKLKMYFIKANEYEKEMASFITPLEMNYFDSSVNELKNYILSTPKKRFIERNSSISYLGGKIKEYLDNNFKSNISISEIAASLGISNAHVSVYFKRDFGISPKQYKNQLLTIRTISRLLDSKKQNKTIADIAFDSGYNEISTFNKQFKRLFMITPRALVN